MQRPIIQVSVSTVPMSWESVLMIQPYLKLMKIPTWTHMTIWIDGSWYDLCFNGVGKSNTIPFTNHYTIKWEVSYYMETIMLNRIDAIARLNTRVTLQDLIMAGLGMRSTTCVSFIGSVLGVDLPVTPYKAMQELKRLINLGHFTY